MIGSVVCHCCHESLSHGVTGVPSIASATRSDCNEATNRNRLLRHHIPDRRSSISASRPSIPWASRTAVLERFGRHLAQQPLGPLVGGLGLVLLAQGAVGVDDLHVSGQGRRVVLVAEGGGVVEADRFLVVAEVVEAVGPVEVGELEIELVQVARRAAGAELLDRLVVQLARPCSGGRAWRRRPRPGRPAWRRRRVAPASPPADGAVPRRRRPSRPSAAPRSCGSCRPSGTAAAPSARRSDSAGSFFQPADRLLVPAGAVVELRQLEQRLAELLGFGRDQRVARSSPAGPSRPWDTTPAPWRCTPAPAARRFATPPGSAGSGTGCAGTRAIALSNCPAAWYARPSRSSASGVCPSPGFSATNSSSAAMTCCRLPARSYRSIAPPQGVAVALVVAERSARGSRRSTRRRPWSAGRGPAARAGAARRRSGRRRATSPPGRPASRRAPPAGRRTPPAAPGPATAPATSVPAPLEVPAARAAPTGACRSPASTSAL